jgi:hypothetical protein
VSGPSQTEHSNTAVVCHVTEHGVKVPGTIENPSRRQAGVILCYSGVSCFPGPQPRFDFGGILPPESLRVELAERHD